jgi:hypothetical protein
LQRPEIKQDNAARPSLLSSVNEINPENGHILAKFETSLGTGAASARSNCLNRKWRVWVGGIMIMIATGTAGISCVKFLFQYKKTDIAPAPSPLAGAQATLSNSSSVSAILEQRFGATADTQVATIVTEPVEPRREVRSGQYGADTGADLPKSSSESNSAQFSGDTPSKRPASILGQDKNKLNTKGEVRHGGLTVPVTHNSGPVREHSRSDQNALKQANGLTKEKTDRDVTMLAALIENTNESQAGKVNTEQRSTKKMHQPAKSKFSQTSTVNLSESVQGRDVVERRPNDSSEALLQRCKQLGFIEGQLCRWRICSGRWESDSACKASAGQS